MVNTVALKRKVKNAASQVLIYLILICIVFIILYPFMQNISKMFMSFEDLVDKSVVFIPKHPTTERITQTVYAMEYSSALLNSFVLCIIMSALQLVTTSLVGYGFARFDFPLKNFWFAMVIFTLLTPGALLMPALYVQFGNISFFGNTLSLLDTPAPLLILSFFALMTKDGLFIFLFRQAFRGIPFSLDEAARIDGASSLCIYGKIMLPNVIPLSVSVFMFSFCWQWTDVYYTRIFMPSFRGISDALDRLANYGVETIDAIVREAMMRTGVILTLIPILLLFLVFQRFFVQGIAGSGIVG